MILPIMKPPTYISYSSLMTWKTCPPKYYLTKVSGYKYKTRTGYPAGIGIAFDATVKEYIAGKLGFNDDRLSYKHLMKDFDCEQKDKAESIGRDTAVMYIKAGMADRILAKQGFGIKINREVYGHWGTIPILGVMDLILGNTPFDWKTRGFSRPTTPTDGYIYSCDHRGRDVGKSTRYSFPLEQDNEDWAYQFVFYNTLLGRPTEDYQAVIHEVVNTKDGVMFYEHDRRIKTDFIMKVKTDLFNMWSWISNDPFDIEVPKAEPKMSKCEKYNTLCDCACDCEPYKKVLEDPANRWLYKG